MRRNVFSHRPNLLRDDSNARGVELRREARAATGTRRRSANGRKLLFCLAHLSRSGGGNKGALKHSGPDRCFT
ncbi:hypothetical protein EYF80_033008 [Liparis tanakae]|uniref:Uncharacterized protein n=1 Tax=Liparis tanakae TaxID=230148 RepID=A0A4Z2GU56_9TELE|nr:hypothetical protein EYF80_033008 [Liparis tanakae]